MKCLAKTLSVFIAIALVVTGCGGGDDGSAEAPTKAEFVARADRICERTDQAQREAVKDYFKARPNVAVNQAANEKVVLAVGLPAIKKETEELDALSVPEGDEDEVEAIIDGLEEAIEEGEEDPGGLVSLKAGLGPFAEVGKLADEYGFKACRFPI